MGNPAALLDLAVNKIERGETSLYTDIVALTCFLIPCKLNEIPVYTYVHCKQ